MEEIAIEQEVSNPQLAILESTSQINLFLAGMGSGKTYLGGIISRNLIADFPLVRGFIGANTYDQLNTSTLFRIREYWKSVGITEWSRENPGGIYVSSKEPPTEWKKCERNFDRFNNIISFINGALIFIGSLDNAVAHSGKEFGWAILDETKDSREEDVKEIILTRLRQPGIFLKNGQIINRGEQSEQWNPLYILTSPAKVQWINEWFGLGDYAQEITNKIYSHSEFFEKVINGRKVVISSTYHNVMNVGENYIQSMLDNNSEDRGKSIVYGNPFTSTGGEFYTSFNRLVHVDEVPVLDNYAVHISYDFNVVPYITLLLWQFVDVGNKKQARCFKEYCLASPHNTTEDITIRAMRDYDKYMMNGLFYYGDATGKARDTRSNYHNYDIVQRVLRHYLNNYSDRVPAKNPLVLTRRDFINALLESKHDVQILIDKDCKNLITDMEFVKEDQEGRKMKEMATDTITKQRYEKYGHCSDSLDYVLVEYFKAIFDKLY